MKSLKHKNTIITFSIIPILLIIISIILLLKQIFYSVELKQSYYVDKNIDNILNVAIEKKGNLTTKQFSTLQSYYCENDKDKCIDVDSSSTYGLYLLIVNITPKEGWKVHSHIQQDIGTSLSISLKNSQNSNLYSFYPNTITTQEQEDFVSNYYKKGNITIPIVLKYPHNQKFNEKSNILITLSVCNKICKLYNLYFPILFSEKNKNSTVSNKQFQETKEFVADIQHDISYNILFIILLSFLAGCILNLMPCVLPVLMLKINQLTTIKQNYSIHTSKYFICTIFGIMFSILFFASLVNYFMYINGVFDINFHFQSPIFIFLLSLIVVLLIANMNGYYSFTIINKISKIDKPIYNLNQYVNYFVTGVLSVMFATSCTAPLFSIVTAFMMTKNSYLYIYLIYFAIGLGLSMPYILLLLRPRILFMLPKRGYWSFIVQKVTNIILILLIIWLLYILYSQTNLANTLNVIYYLNLLFFILRLRFNLKNNFDCRIDTSVIIVIMTLLFYNTIQEQKYFLREHNNLSNPRTLKKVEHNSKYNLIWSEFSLSKLQEALKNQQQVIVNVTADWCVSCKINDFTVLNTNFFYQITKRNNVLLLKANYTSYNENISKYLKRLKRISVPTVVFYNKKGEEKILPTMLRKSHIKYLFNE